MAQQTFLIKPFLFLFRTVYPFKNSDIQRCSLSLVLLQDSLEIFSQTVPSTGTGEIPIRIQYPSSFFQDGTLLSLALLTHRGSSVTVATGKCPLFQKSPFSDQNLAISGLTSIPLWEQGLETGSKPFLQVKLFIKYTPQATQNPIIITESLESLISDLVKSQNQALSRLQPVSFLHSDYFCFIFQLDIRLR